MSYAGGSLVGFGWSFVVARRLAYERRRLRREAVWEGAGLAILGGWACGAVTGVLDLCVAIYLKLDRPAAERLTVFAGFSAQYAELCVGWCFIYLIMSGAADRRWAAARAMTQALSRYMERSFAEDGRELVPIGEQVEVLQTYLGIEKIRFGDRLQVRAEIPERLACACAPSLILHPLVENAMKYAVAATADPVEVEIAADLIGDTLRLRVRDSGGDPEAPAAPGLGIGLSNVEARLAGHYGERGSLRCKRLTPKGFVAEIQLPLEFACTPSAA